MKSVLISIKTKWCELIASGKKTVDVRKTRPKIETPFKVYIYMTAGDAVYPVTINGAPYTCSNVGGKCVIGEFVCDKIIELAPINRADEDIEKQACLSREQIVEYLRGKGYGWHISDLVIYDKPKELGEFRTLCKMTEGSCYFCDYAVHGMDGDLIDCDTSLTRPPQSWCYVEGE